MILTSKELEIIRLMAEGLTTKEMVRVLNMPEATLETYRCRLFVKMGVRNGFHCVAYALRNGLIV
jgi:DNA-binding NarL/FixJ family response regulator